ncbi:MFS transporter [Streptomyces liangshanensis]|uniref:MFS transporter n=1 Tax=Streptomyces liangshanensis TaxID=2717324 RepID=A0A6G9H903_9ACTN|nr:MFS transporter [Streptomyces liangshanensis]QIQ06557.1 MFS transporter [Streptomyces liangshanensis]
MLAAFTFNTAENLPVGLLEPISENLRVSLSAVGLLITGYGVTVAVASLPLAHLVRAAPRRHVLTGLLAALVVSSLAAALAPSYWPLLASRLLTALAQALFWAVMGPVAVGLFAPEVRGRVVGALSVAGSLALVLGVPAGTWLGRQTDWRVPVAALAGPGLVSLITIAVLLPTSRPDEEHAAHGVACLVGVSITGALLDRFPRSALPTAVTVQAVGMLGLYAAGTRPVAAIGFLVLMGGALGPVFMATQNEMLRCAPGRTDIALAANSGAYNAGIAAGAALGGLALSVAGVRGAFLAGGLTTTGACAVLLGGRLRHRRSATTRAATRKAS